MCRSGRDMLIARGVWEAEYGNGHAPSSLIDIAENWGSGFEISCTDCQLTRSTAEAVAEGPILIRTLSSGPSVCSSELTTVSDNQRVGIVNRSVMIVVNLDGSPVTYTVEGASQLQVQAGGAVAFCSAENIRLTAAYRKGECSRLLVIQYCPSNLIDPYLAQQLDEHLSGTVVKPLIQNCRTRALANELFAPDHTGFVGRLLADSCALELLARAIEGADQAESSSASAIKPKDVAKIHELCERLMLNLDAEHRLHDLARDFGMSTSTLKSKFLAVTGQPVFKYLRERRLERAQAGLINEDWTVSQAAYYVGYRHPTNFSTAFRKRFGMAPTSLLTRR